MTDRDSVSAKSIVLVDADPWIRDSLSLYFQRRLCRFAAFDNVADGLRAVVSGQHDVIICDYAMPELNGIAFLSLARRFQPDSIRILSAGYPAGSLADAADREGIHACLQKPFTLDEFEELIAELVGRSSAACAPAPERAAE